MGSQPWQHGLCSVGFRSEGYKPEGAVQSSSAVKEKRQAQACRGESCRSWEGIFRSENESWIVWETPRCGRCQSRPKWSAYRTQGWSPRGQSTKMEGKTHPLISDTELQGLEFALLHFGPVFPYCASISPSWGGSVYSVPLNVGSMWFPFWLCRRLQTRAALSLRRGFSS